jgi:hypothetical protein
MDLKKSPNTLSLKKKKKKRVVKCLESKMLLIIFQNLQPDNTPLPTAIPTTIIVEKLGLISDWLDHVNLTKLTLVNFNYLKKNKKIYFNKNNSYKFIMT